MNILGLPLTKLTVVFPAPVSLTSLPLAISDVTVPSVAVQPSYPASADGVLTVTVLVPALYATVVAPAPVNLTWEVVVMFSDPPAASIVQY